MIELRLLRQFIAVAEERHVRRAAERLGMAQPPLSTAMRRLEDVIGAALFDRSRRRVALTPAGTALLEEARRTLAQAEHAVAVARQAGQGLTGLLRVTFVGSAMFERLPPLLKTLRTRHPGLAVDLREATTMRQLDDLRGGRGDLGFVIPPLPDSEGLELRPAWAEPMVAVVPADHALAGSGRIYLSDLVAEPFVMFPQGEGPGFHAAILEACAKAGFVPRVAQSAHQMHAIVSLVAAGFGVSLVPASLRRLRPHGVRYLPLAGAAPQARIAAVWRRGDRSPALLQALSLLREETAER
jgi:DNA-binding transcriptional LysR family regulator